MGPVYFNIFINDLDVGVERMLIKFADDIKLGGVANPSEDRIKLSRLKNWAKTCKMSFNKM